VVEIETGTRLGIATDLGRPTAQVRHALSGSDFLILEANHDEQMLHTGPYPHAVRRRIASSHGHLSNHAAARFAEELLHPRLTGVLLAHLSRECNTPELAQEVVETRLRAAGFGGLIAVAGQDEPSAVLDVEELRGRSGPPQLTLL
jgi:phosphoribosyl 1,2-cyclic phosphodiesterase